MTDGQTPEDAHTISSPGEPNCSGEIITMRQVHTMQQCMHALHCVQLYGQLLLARTSIYI